jgi:hypothetical protein
MPSNSEHDDNTTSNQSALAIHMSKKRGTSYNDELETYLNEPPANFDMDILAFWKVNHK